MKKDPNLKAIQQEPWHGTFKLYVIGFVLSVLLTLGSFFLVIEKVLTGITLDITISILAFIQVVVQLVLFLHLGTEEKPRWNLLVFSFMLLVVVILIGGSLWIMNNLNYNVMPTMPSM